MIKTTLQKFAKATVCVCVACTLAIAGLAGCSAQSASEKPASSSSSAATKPAKHTVKDMAGRSVELPTDIKSVATFGSVGVLNAFVETMGKGNLIANQMPAGFTKNDDWAMQYKFAPQIKNGPVLETADGINIEETLKLAPELCVTMQEEQAQQLQEKGLNTVVLKWENTEDVKVAIELMGEVFDAQDRANDYNAYFDKMVKKANDLTQNIPSEQRPTVVYGDLVKLSNPHLISEWWIEAAGGVSVTKADHKKNSMEYTLEQLLAWQPQVALLNVKTKLSEVYADQNLATLPAIKDKKVYTVPIVAHVWGNRTTEQPLTVMWTMNKLYPEKYTEKELSEDIKYFYDHFFNYKMTDEEVNNIINYKAQTK